MKPTLHLHAFLGTAGRSSEKVQKLPMQRSWLAPIASLVTLTALSAGAQTPPAAPIPPPQAIRGESMPMRIPEGYVIDAETKQANLLVTEMVPRGQTMQNWQENLTVQVFPGQRELTLTQYQTAMRDVWMQACPQGEIANAISGTENGYPFALWLQSCPQNPGTGQPEFTWFKAIKGNDHFYVVQKNSKFRKNEQQLAMWMRYLRTVQVCDTRLRDRPCGGTAPTPVAGRGLGSIVPVIPGVTAPSHNAPVAPRQ